MFESIPLPQQVQVPEVRPVAVEAGNSRTAEGGPVQRLAQLSRIANGGGGVVQGKAMGGGLPMGLRSGIEQLSGIAMGDVSVHYNSSRPAQLQAHAYAQGTEIHVAPGQERHLAHEAWHVVQQKQGRVKPTLQLKGVAINDDSALEREADVMGAKALATGHEGRGLNGDGIGTRNGEMVSQRVVQRMIYLREGGRITMPLNASPRVAVKYILSGAKKAHEELMAQYQAELSDTTARVVRRDQLSAWLKANVNAPAPAALPFEAGLDPAEFPAGVSNYIRNVAGYMLSPSGAINVRSAPQVVHQIPMGWLPEALRAYNVARRGRKQYSDNVNVISAGLTITYLDQAGQLQTWQGLLPGGWSSGNVEDHCSSDSGKCAEEQHEDDPSVVKEEEDGGLSSLLEAAQSSEMAAMASGQGKAEALLSDEDHTDEEEPIGLPEVSEAIEEPDLSTYRGFLQAQKHLAKVKRSNSLSKAVENAAMGAVDPNSLYHSENAFAFDAHGGNVDIDGELQRFVNEATPLRVLSVVLDVDSHPNTMCVNMCRGSIESVRQLVHAAALVQLAGMMDPQYMTHSRVHAEVAFNMSPPRENAYNSLKKALANGPEVNLAQVPFGQQDAPTGYGFEVWWSKVSAGPKRKGAAANAPFLSSDGQNYQIQAPFVPGDGNCFFECMSRLLQDGRDHAAMRAALVAHMNDQSIAADRAWAEDRHLRGMANLLQRRILVHVIRHDGTELVLQGYGNPAHPILRIANVNFNHFELVGPPQAAVAVPAAAPVPEADGSIGQARKKQRGASEAPVKQPQARPKRK